MKSAEEVLGDIDILVNNAGIMRYGLIELCDEDGWDEVINTNIKGALNSVAAVVQNMVKRKSGVIVNISSAVANQVFNHHLVL